MNFLVYIPLAQQIKLTLDKHFDLIMDYSNRPKNESISDIDDGLVYKQTVSKNPGSIVLSLTINTDGGQVYKSKNHSIWPVQIYQNFLPPNIRFKPENILLCALYFGEHKPLITKIMHPLAEEIDWLQENGIKFIRNGSMLKCIPVVMFASVDWPVRATLSGRKTYAGVQACSMCLHPAKSIVDHTGSKYVRYVKITPEPQQRKHNEVVQAVNYIGIKKTKNSYGLITVPAMIMFPQFDLVFGFVIDYMHNALLGVMRLLLDFWMDNHRLCKNSKRFKPMSQQNRNKLDQRLLALKPYENITRKPRSVQDRGRYKAIEYRNLLLYYLRYGLQGLLDDRKLKHFELLSAATYILLKYEVITMVHMHLFE